MSNQCLFAFWNKCEDRLKHYTNLFNIDMSSNGFQIQYKVMDKSPIAVCYTLIDLSRMYRTQSRCPSQKTFLNVLDNFSMLSIEILHSYVLLNNGSNSSCF